MQKPNDRAEIAAAIVVTAEVVGHEISPTAAKAMSAQLASYRRADIDVALSKCQRECRARLTLAAILERMPGGHVGADEAWAIASRGEDESATVVWTDEIAEAFGVARGLLLNGDAVGARMAFRETYSRMTQEARDAGRKPKWWPTLGHDPRSRESAIREAVAMGRLTADGAQRYLPHGAIALPGLADKIGRLPS